MIDEVLIKDKSFFGLLVLLRRFSDARKTTVTGLHLHTFIKSYLQLQTALSTREQKPAKDSDGGTLENFYLTNEL